ncbi:MAG: tape measure protein [Bryobacterales bacterium]|nr:tape measure protein [Bryobacterales bacterium]
MADLKVGIVLQAVDRATAPLRGLSRSAGGTRAALAKLSGQASQIGKLRGLRTELGTLGSKLDLSRRRTAELGRELKGTDSPSKKLSTAFERSRSRTVRLARAHKRQKGELRGLSASLRKAGVDTRRLNAEQERLDRTSGRLQRRLDRLGRTDASPRARGGGFGRGIAGGVLGSAAFAGVGGAVRSLGGFVRTASMFETLETTLGTIEGSSGKAKASMAWISDFAARTPFELDQVSEAFVKLRAYGMDPTKGLLRSLGDTASAMGKDMMQAVEAVADAVTGENERLKEFGIKARTSGDTVTYEYGGGRVATANKNDRAEIQRVLTGIMDRQYSGAMDDRMKTFSGMMSNLGDQWTRFQIKVMESGPFEVLKDRLRGVLDRINAMAESGELQELADRVGGAFMSAFEVFEQDILPVLRDEVWPALKDIGDIVRDIFGGANSVAEAFGGWGNVIKAFAAYRGLRLALGAGRAAVGRGRSLLDFGGDIRDAVTSDRAKRMRATAARLAGSALDASKGRFAKLASSGSGLAKAGAVRFGGGLASLGKTLSSLALRFAPLLMGALKALGAVFAGISLPVAAAIAAIAGGAYLIWKHWEPIKAFFSKLWAGVQAAFSSAWEKLASIDWTGVGKRLLSTLAQGLRSAGGAVWGALKGVLGKLVDLLPGSDARAGPLSRLTASGSAIVSTLGEGVRRSGAGALQRPLSRALGTAAAGLALTIPASATIRPVPPERPALEKRLRAATGRPIPVEADPETAPRTRPAFEPAADSPAPRPRVAVTRIVHHHYRIEIRQLPGEDSRELADRVLRELERRQALAGREALGDGY